MIRSPENPRNMATTANKLVVDEIWLDPIVSVYVGSYISQPSYLMPSKFAKSAKTVKLGTDPVCVALA